MTASALPMSRARAVSAICSAAAVFLAGMTGSLEVSAEECGRLCDLRWMAKASVAEVRAELDARPGAINERGKKSYTPLHFAAQANPDPRVLALLLERGSDLEARTVFGETPLHIAAGVGGMAVLSVWAHVFDNHKALSREFGLASVLEEARGILERNFLSGNTLEVVKLLLDNGADITARNKGGFTPITYAAYSTMYPRVIELLVQYGADPNDTGDADFSPLHVAGMFNPNPLIAEALLQQGANLEFRNKSGETPMHLATAWNAPVLEVLLEHGGNIEARDEKGDTPLHRAAESWVADITRILVDHGADLETRNNQGRTPLQRALAKNDNPSIALFLIERGADIHVRDRKRRTTYELLESGDHDPCEWSCEMYERLETILQ